MMFLLRMAFWVSVVLALLPSFAAKQPSSVKTDFEPAQAITAASATLSDLREFCARQPDACAAGGQFASVFGQRTEEGARILYDLIGERLRRASIVGGSGFSTAEPSTASGKPSQDTLTANDLAAPWRGTSTRRDVVARRSS